MRRLVTWIGGTAAGITAYRLVQRRRAAAVAAETEPEPWAVSEDARADELRAKLAETRAAEPAPEPDLEEPVATAEPVQEPVAAEPDVDEPAAEEPAVPGKSPEDRRRRVHEEGRTAIEEMRPE